MTIHTAGSPIEHTRDAARTFVEHIGGTSYIAIISYGRYARVDSDFTRCLDTLTRVFDSLTTFEYGGSGNISHALREAGYLMASVPANAIRNVVVFTSGYSYP